MNEINNNLEEDAIEHNIAESDGSQGIAIEESPRIKGVSTLLIGLNSKWVLPPFY